jgi:GNAT superfamily N-acetyltransferase
MLDEGLVRRWRAAWCLARGWTSVTEDDGVIVVRIDKPGRTVEYLVPDADAHPERVDRAAALAAAADGTAWVTLATEQPAARGEQLGAAGLTLEPVTESMMTTELADHPVRPPREGYVVHLERRGEVVRVRLTPEGSPEETAASGWAAVVGTDAVADRIETAEEHRRKGLGTAVMSALASEAVRMGAKHGILVASAAGRALYETLGWHTIADVVIAKSQPLDSL